MSYHHDHPEQDTTIPLIIGIGILVAVGVVAALAKNIADALGADFWVVLNAMGRAAVGLLFFGGLVIGAAYMGMFHRLGCAIGLLLAVTGSVVWWCFGAVLDSMALGGGNPATDMAFHYGDFPLWDSWWFQWGGSALLLICAIAALVCALNDG